MKASDISEIMAKHEKQFQVQQETLAKLRAQTFQEWMGFDPLPKRIDCKCPCHRPGTKIMHCMPCCEL